MQEKKSQRSWEKFWKDRDEPDLRPFDENFKFLNTRLYNRFHQLKGLSSLEVGCGRAIMSDYLHAWGWDTYCVDKYYILPKNGQTHKFFTADAFDLPFPNHHFDLVFSYGLLEHFNIFDQLQLLNHMAIKTKEGGITIHYVVPQKWTNVNADRSVYRDFCHYLRSQNVTWVYPVLGKEWITNKWLGKGFWYENSGFSNSKIN